MKLTSKAETAFKAYYVDNTKKVYFDNTNGLKTYPNRLMQWGVYQDWADSLGYELYISKEEHPLEYFWSVCDLLRSFNEGTCKTPVKKHITQRLRSWTI
jgi:hypothetical protein